MGWRRPKPTSWPTVCTAPRVAAFGPQPATGVAVVGGEPHRHGRCRPAAGESCAAVRRRRSAPTKRSVSDGGDGTAPSRRCSMSAATTTRSPWTLDPERDAADADRVAWATPNDKRRWLGPRRSSPANGRRCAYRGDWSSTRSSGRSWPSRQSPPAPWSAANEFRTWLAPRYWQALHDTPPRPVDCLPRSEGRSAVDVPGVVPRRVHLRRRTAAAGAARARAKRRWSSPNSCAATA